MTWQLKLKIQDETKEKKEGGEWLIIKRRVSIGKRQITPRRRTELLIKNVGKMLEKNVGEKCWRKISVLSSSQQAKEGDLWGQSRRNETNDHSINQLIDPNRRLTPWPIASFQVTVS